MKTGKMKHIPPELRDRLEQARKEQLALFRGLDRIGASGAELPQKELVQLMTLDEDCAEALWALDHPRGLNLKKMVKDTEKSLRRVPKTRESLRAKLSEPLARRLHEEESRILPGLTLEDAYRDIPE